MMSIESFGVDAPFVDGVVTPFVSKVSEIFNEAEKEAFPKESRGGTLLEGPDLSGLGPEKGGLDRLYAQYVDAPTEENSRILLGEVERYGRRITIGKGGGLAKYVSQSVTDYASTDVSLKVAVNICHLHALPRRRISIPPNRSRCIHGTLHDSRREGGLISIHKHLIDHLPFFREIRLICR
jgi:hypothetical protein